jgi:hypothetical protein
MTEVGNAVDVLASFWSALILDEHCEVNGFMGDGLECSIFVVGVVGGNGCARAVVSEELSVGVGWVWERSRVKA